TEKKGAEACLMAGEVVSHLMEKLPADYLRVRRSEKDAEEWYRLPAPAGRLIAEFEVRVRQWLSVDREACLKFLQSKEGGGFLSPNHPVFATAFADYALEEGEEEWLIKVAGGKEKVYRARLQELGAAGFLAKYGGDFNKGGDELARVYAVFDFEDRDLVLETILEGKGSWWNKQGSLKGFLSNPNHRDSEVISWIRELWGGRAISEEFKKESHPVFKEWLESNPEAPVAERMELIEQISGWKMSPGIFMEDSLDLLLNGGRDWKYEFRHGRVEANEVFEQLKGKLSAIHAEAEGILRSRLYYELVSQDPVRAKQLLEPLGEIRRAEVQLRALGTAFHEADPMLARAYYDSLPEATSDAGRDLMEVNWGWQVHFMIRQ
ncbi:MAG: hypothetical protein ACI8UZ_003259, partial [Akkermansiaceae bacterium]